MVQVSKSIIELESGPTTADRVVANGVKFEWRPVTSGVTQGQVLSVIYINDIDVSGFQQGSVLGQVLSVMYINDIDVSGVPQGSVLGLVLSVTYINDIDVSGFQ